MDRESDSALAPISLEPIGVFHCTAKYPYDVPRQATLAGANPGWIQLQKGRNFEAALEGLEGFSRLWVLFLFHHNAGVWHPKVQPPRHVDHKLGVFATRSPYRPNPIGLSCVELVKIQGGTLLVQGHDLLDGTPILDIKPYLPYADAFPDAADGWTRQQELPLYSLEIAPALQTKLLWLKEHGLACLESFLHTQLEEDPTNPKRHRLVYAPEDTEKTTPILAYRTWRIPFQVQENPPRVLATDLRSAYSPEELAPDAEDPYHDKELHRAFRRTFCAPEGPKKGGRRKEEPEGPKKGGGRKEEPEGPQKGGRRKEEGGS